MAEINMDSPDEKALLHSNGANESNQNKQEDKKESRIERLDLIKALVSAYGEDADGKLKDYAQKVILDYLQQEGQVYESFKNYNVLMLYDNGMLIRSDADKIYSAITSFSDDRPVLLILFSDGGSAASAYLIGKLCREYSKGNFSVVVPRRAKSAATLICCAANEIHMGSLSELGPIDPQINDLPALGLKNSVEHIAEMSKRYPESSDMFAKYLNLSLKPIDIGYYERVAESAWQYAERLLSTHAELLPRTPKDIAFDLVYKYKDHSFVIDKEEAESIFGPRVVRANTDEYELGNALYKALDLVRSLLRIFNHNFYHIGSFTTESTIQAYSSAS